MVELEWVMWNQWINYHQSQQRKSTAHDQKKKGDDNKWSILYSKYCDFPITSMFPVAELQVISPSNNLKLMLQENMMTSWCQGTE